MIRYLFIFLLIPSLCFAAIRYVDNGTIESDATWSGVDGESYTSTHPAFPGPGFGYATIQNAIDDMSVGDKIYLRGGLYQPVAETTSAKVYIPTSLSGTSWNEGEYCYMGSFPTEWAVIDGEWDSPKGILVGNGNTWSGCDALVQYWEFERLEFYRGTKRGGECDGSNPGGAGLMLRGGPLKVRFCVFRDCFDDCYANNPSAFSSHIMRESVIEFNYFYHNGFNGTNGDQIQLYTDYKDEHAGYTDLDDINCAMRKNIIRYNYFDGSDGNTMAEAGFKHKGTQLLTDENNSYDTYKEYGDKIEHNIFINHSSSAFILHQDYVQAYKNIVVGPGQIDIGQYHSLRRWNAVVYNNTLINTSYNSWIENDPAYPFSFNDVSLNNIFAHFNSDDQPGNLYIAQWWMDGNMLSSPIVKDERLDHNYIYDEHTSNSNCNGKPIRVGDQNIWDDDTHFGCFEVDEYNTENGTTNYQKASSEGTDNLFQGDSGADQYITRPQHQVVTGVTIADGGIGGNHPYLDGVTLPSYLGATNPDDHDWVAGVLAMNASWFQAQEPGSTPDWIEGAPPQADNTGAIVTGGTASISTGGTASIVVQ